MKKTLPLITSSIVYCAMCIMQSSAQITLGSNDLPHSGHIYNLSTAVPFSGMDATLTGANFTWDYSQLATTRTGGRVDTFITVAQTASFYSIYFTDIAFNPHRSNQAIAGTNFTLGTFITVTNAFNFFYNSTSSYNQTGFGANINIIPTPIGYTPEDVVYKYPVAYGNVDSSNSSYNLPLGFIYYQRDMTRHNEVDGWGQLTTPYGTFAALRIKSTVVQQDTFHVDTIVHYGMKLPPITTVEYKWLGAGKGEPLLQINMTGPAVTSIVYQDSVRTAGIPFQEKPAVIDLNIFPNPASDRVFMQYSLSSGSDVHIDITDLSGAIIVSSDEKQQEAGIHITKIDLPPALPSSGDYFVRLSTGSTQIIKPLMIAK